MKIEGTSNFNADGVIDWREIVALAREHFANQIGLAQDQRDNIGVRAQKRDDIGFDVVVSYNKRKTLK